MSVTGRGAPVSSRETLTTGRSLQQRWRWSVRSGRGRGGRGRRGAHAAAPQQEDVVVSVERQLVLDANILIRAVLGRRVRQIITTHAEHVSFLAPAVAYDEASAYLPTLLAK